MRKSSFQFWKAAPKPGGAKEVKGAQFPPLDGSSDESKTTGIEDGAATSWGALASKFLGSGKGAGAGDAQNVGEGGSASPSRATDNKSITLSAEAAKNAKFAELLEARNIDLESLRALSWTGIPTKSQPTAWKLLLGYLPLNSERRDGTLKRKRKEYADAVPQYFNISESERTAQEVQILRQILVDVPRTNADMPLFHQDAVQRLLERILYIWAIKHPASGYVQGINDLLTPFFVVFLSAHVDEVYSCDISTVSKEDLAAVEADCYWALTKMLDGIQDHYTFQQPGVQRMVNKLEELIKRMDAALYEHLQNEGMQFLQFAFRWMNCLLLREFSLKAIVRLWDTYLSQDNGFEVFHVYVCASFLLTWSAKLRDMEFQDLVLFLQDLPTRDWGANEVETLLSQAYMLSTCFESSPNHLDTT